MVASAVAIRTESYRVAWAIRALMCQVLDVMNFEKWGFINLERRWLATAFADAFSLLAYPGSHFRIANVGFTRRGLLLRLCNSVRRCFKRTFFQFQRPLFEYRLVGSRLEVF